jgi:Flp pilus assembly pilin Flp
MRKIAARRPQQGQGLIEYALILALVAVAAIVILGAVGVAVQRVIGLTAGALGAHKNSQVAQVINITAADCFVIDVGSSYMGGAFAANGYTGLFIKVDTNVPLDQLNMAGTESMLKMPLFEDQSTIVPPPGISHYTFRIDLATYTDATRCPHSSVVQSLQGAIAVSPVEVTHAH